MTLIDFKARLGLREHFCLTSRIAANSHRLPQSHAQPLAQPCHPPMTHFPSWKHKSCLSPERLVCVPGSLPLPPPSEQSRDALEGGRVQGCWWDHGGISVPLALLLQCEIPRGQHCPFLAYHDQKGSEVTCCCPSAARQAAGVRNTTAQEKMPLTLVPSWKTSCA